MAVNSSEVAVALMQKLSADATLTGLMPDGVWWGLAAPNLTQFVLLSQVEHADTYTMPGRTLWERFEYLVKAVQKGTSSVTVESAAVRIHELLQNTTLTVPGYHAPMVVQRVQFVWYPEVDEVTDERWQHQGGHYEVMITPQ